MIAWRQGSDWDREIPLLDLLVSKSLGTFSITHCENSIGSPASYLRVKVTEPPPSTMAGAMLALCSPTDLDEGNMYIVASPIIKV